MPRRRPVPKQRDRTQQDVTDYLENLLVQLETFPYLDGVEIEFTIAATSTEKKRHGLGLEPAGALIPAPDGSDARVYLSSKDKDHITLGNAGSAEVTVSAWVYL